MKNQRIYHLFLLMMLVTSCAKKPLPTADVIQFAKPNLESFPADGFSVLDLEVDIPANSDPQTAVTLTTDLGTFINANAQTVTVYATADGKAIAHIKCSTAGTATIKATASTTLTATKTVNFTAPDPNNIFTMQPFTDNVVADGTSVMTLTAAINKGLPPAGQTVSYAADNGATFSNGNATASVPADGNGNAIAYLRKSVEGPAHITVTDGAVTRNFTVNFIKSIPDNILLTNAPSMASGFGNNLTISIALLKTIGKPATGFLFSYTAMDSGGNLIGLFNNGTASDANGNATVSFTTGTSPYKGAINITVSLQQYPNVKSTSSVLVN